MQFLQDKNIFEHTYFGWENIELSVMNVNLDTIIVNFQKSIWYLWQLWIIFVFVGLFVV